MRAMGPTYTSPNHVNSATVGIANGNANGGVRWQTLLRAHDNGRPFLEGVVLSFTTNEWFYHQLKHQLKTV
jgi:hypothetical protein